MSSLTCAMLSVSVRAWFVVLVVLNLFRAVLIAVIFGMATSSMFLMLRMIPAYSHMIFWICFLYAVIFFASNFPSFISFVGISVGDFVLRFLLI